jgi:hypothetical protein
VSAGVRTWSSGETVVVRYRSIDGAFRAARPLTVVEDGPGWLVTHLPQDTVVAVPVLTDGRGLRDVPLDERWAHRRATALRPWHGSDLVMLFPREREFSLWLFREQGVFRGWYVNLEERHVRGEHTIDTRDGILDLWVPAATGEPRWKDEDELAAAIVQGRVTADEAARIRAEAERVAAERPWPTGWEDFRRDPAWPAPELPDGWDAP